MILLCYLSFVLAQPLLAEKDGTASDKNKKKCVSFRHILKRLGSVICKCEVCLLIGVDCEIGYEIQVTVLDVDLLKKTFVATAHPDIVASIINKNEKHKKKHKVGNL